jgi:hypothetical protein
LGSGKIAAISALLAVSLISIAVVAVRARSRPQLFPHRGIKGLATIEGSLTLIALGTWIAASSLIPVGSFFFWLIWPVMFVVNAVTLVGQLRQRRQALPALIDEPPPNPPRSPDERPQRLPRPSS